MRRKSSPAKKPGPKRAMAGRDRRTFPEESPNAILYRGRSILPTSVAPEIRTEQLQVVLAATTSAVGVLDGVGISSSSASVRSNGADFSSWAAVFREYRTRSIRVEFHPNVEYGVATAPVLYSPVNTVVDRDDNSSVGSVSNIQSNNSLRVFAIDQHWFREAKCESTGEADFVSTSADPVKFFTIKVFATGLSNSTTYGTFLIRWVVQFKTRD